MRAAAAISAAYSASVRRAQMRASSTVIFHGDAAFGETWFGGETQIVTWRLNLMKRKQQMIAGGYEATDEGSRKSSKIRNSGTIRNSQNRPPESQ